MVFRFAQLLIEKETAINEITKQLQKKNEVTEIIEEIKEEKELDIEKIIQQIVPESPQNMTLEKFTEKVLANIAAISELVQGVFYVKNKTTGAFEAKGKYAYYASQPPVSFAEGESLPGQVAKDKKLVNIKDIPENYCVVVSGLGSCSPKDLLIFPLLEKGETTAIIELATFKPYDTNFEKVFEKVSPLLSKIIVKINK
jgi:two-component system chemotaxis sensor kinase CheA